MEVSREHGVWWHGDLTISVIPLPVALWPEPYRGMFFPFNLIFSIAWSFEM